MVKLKILIDENLSRNLVRHLEKNFPGSKHLSDENLTNTSDKVIWDYAQRYDFTILTKDSDFYHLSATFGCPPKVIRINCGNKSTAYIKEHLNKNSSVILNFIKGDEDCYLDLE